MSADETTMELLEAADDYFEFNIQSDKWGALTDDQKLAAIVTAQGDINSLPLRKTATYSGSAATPTITDVIPVATKNEAIFEQAVFLTQITNDRVNLQAQGVKSIGISGGVSESFTPPKFGVALAPRAKAKLSGYFAVGAIT
jgi:hypothetical protein